MKNLRSFDYFLNEEEGMDSSQEMPVSAPPMDQERSAEDSVWKNLRNKLMTLSPRPNLLRWNSDGMPAESLNWGSFAGPGYEWGFSIHSWDDAFSIGMMPSMSEAEKRRVINSLSKFFKDKGYYVQESPSAGYPTIYLSSSEPDKVKEDLEEMIRKFPLR